MKKRIFNIVLTVFIFAVLLPAHVLAANTNDEIQITEQGAITIISQHAAKEGISSLQFGLSVEPTEPNAKVSFSFSDSAAKIAEFRYNEESGLLNVYMAGSKALFGDSDTLLVGTVVVQNQDGKDVCATVNVEKESLKYVYWTTEGATALPMEEAKIPEQPVTVNNAEQPTEPPAQPPASGQSTNSGKPTNHGGGNDDVSKSEALKDFQETLKNAESYVAGNYTNESYQAMKNAMREANAVLNSPMPTDEEVANALQNLQNAMGELELADNDSKTDSNKGETDSAGSGNGIGSNSNTGTDSKTEKQRANEESGEKAASVRTGNYVTVLLFVGLLLIVVIGLWYKGILLRDKE